MEVGRVGKKYLIMKILIVGAGFAGAVFGRLAAENGFEVDIIDNRSHIGGNCFSYADEETGVEIHKYGPHIFHTNNKKVWDFVNRFSDFNNYVNRVKAVSNGAIYSLPINLGTINQFFRRTMSPKLAEQFIREKRILINPINNLEDHILNSLGKELYEAFYKYYTIKQWGVDPREIPVLIAKRLPIRYNYNDNYFNDRFQGIPVNGYTVLFKRMLDLNNIKIMLNTSFDEFRTIWRGKYSHLVFCGSLDDYFKYEFGDLEYRTVSFEEIREKEIQGNAVTNYTDESVEFTRIHEHKWFTPEKSFDYSVGFKEYASATTSRNAPYYPISNDQTKLLYSSYQQLADKETDVIFIGRLANYKYYDMHQVIALSIKKFNQWISN